MSDTTKQYRIVGLGELLWDLLPAGKQMGGAPANFAYHAAALGDLGVTASRVGDDDLGREALAQIEGLKLSTEFVQVDKEVPTGTVGVTLSEGGQPSYVIHQGVAWDAMESTEQWKSLAASTDAVCFGSLAQRCPTSASTVQQFLKDTPESCLKVFDVNLRQDYYSAEVLRAGFEAAGIVKLNDEELPVVLECLRSKEGTHTPLPEGPEGLEVGGKELLGMFTLKLLCITRGGEGAFLMRPGEELVKVSPVPCVVADTIGAGDSFTAALVHHFLRGKLSLQEMGDAANKWAAWVASQTGATPAVDPAVKKAVTGAE